MTVTALALVLAAAAMHAGWFLGEVQTPARLAGAAAITAGVIAASTR